MNSIKIIENLDSLWLFSNVLSSRTRAFDSDHDVDGSATPKSEPSNPMTPILQNQQTQSLDSEVGVQRCLRCCELGAKGEAEREDEEKMERRRRRGKRRFKSDWDFDGFWMTEGTRYVYERFGSQHQFKMPPIRDGMAMKEHLKSWAYTVACTVR